MGRTLTTLSGRRLSKPLQYHYANLPNWGDLWGLNPRLPGSHPGALPIKVKSQLIALVRTIDCVFRCKRPEFWGWESNPHYISYLLIALWRYKLHPSANISNPRTLVSYLPFRFFRIWGLSLWHFLILSLLVRSCRLLNLLFCLSQSIWSTSSPSGMMPLNASHTNTWAYFLYIVPSTEVFTWRYPKPLLTAANCWAFSLLVYCFPVGECK